MASKDQTKIIYIMGYGRSGSTILDIILNQHEDAFSVGALNNLYKWMLKGHPCSCGEPVDTCSFWGDIVREIYPYRSEKLVTQLDEVQSLVEESRHLTKLVTDGFDEDLKANYSIQMRDLLNAITRHANSSILIDSSKTTRDCTGRPYSLHTYADVQVKAIHLLRDGRGVAWSAMKKSGSSERKRLIHNRFFNFLRAVLSWTYINNKTLEMSRHLPDDAVMVLRYEDLCAAPSETIIKLGDFIGLDYTKVAQKVKNAEKLETSHNLGGNEIRFTDGLRFNPDHQWEQKMPRTYKLLFQLIGGRTAKKFGF